MLMKWLEPAIQNRIESLVDDYCDNGDVDFTYQRFTSLFERVKQSEEADRQQALLELEGLFNSYFRLAVDLSYRAGFKDGLDLGGAINKDNSSSIDMKKANPGA